MAAKQYEPPAAEAAATGQAEAWAEQFLGVLKKVADRRSIAAGRPLTTEAARAVASFIDLDKRLETLKAP